MSVVPAAELLIPLTAGLIPVTVLELAKLVRRR